MLALLAAVTIARTIASSAPGIVTWGPAAADRAGAFLQPEVEDLGLVRWRRDRDVRADGPVSTPSLSEGTAYVTVRGALAALDVTGGALRWRAEADVIAATPVVGPGVVVTRGTTGLLSFDPRDGRVLRSVELPGGDAPVGRAEPEPALVGDASTVLVLAPDASLLAYDLPTLETRWRVATVRPPGGSQHRLSGALALADDRVFAVARPRSGPAVLAALDVRDGSVLWIAGLPAATVTEVLVVGDEVVVGTPTRTLAVDAATGEHRGPVPSLVTEDPGQRGRAAVGDHGLLIVGEGTREVLQRRGHRFVVTGRAETSLLTHPVAAADGQLGVAHAHDGSVLGINVATGGVDWASPRIGAGGNRSSLTDDLVLTPLDGALAGLDRDRGTVRWRTLVTGTASCPLTGGGELTFLAGGGRLHAYDDVDGTVTWSYEASAPVEEPAAAGTGRAAALAGDRLTVVDSRTGVVASTTELPSVAIGPPAIVGDRVYVAGRGLREGPARGWVASVSGRQTRWIHTSEAAFLQPPTVAGDRVFVVSEDGVVTALAADAGAVLWRTDPTVGPAAPVVATAEVVVTRDRRGALVARDPGLGTVRWRRDLGLSLLGTPATVDDVVVVRDTTRTLLALDVETGEPRWEARVDVALTGPPVVAGDRIYAGVETGVVVLDAATGGLATLIERPSPVVGTPVVGTAGVTVCQADGSIIALGG